MGIDEVVTELYGLAPDEFTAARNAAAKSLRAAGDRQGATAVGALRRPSVNQWALNMVARTDADLVASWVDAAATVRAAHEAAAVGDPGDLRSALSTVRDLTASVRAAAAPWSTRDDLTLLLSDVTASADLSASFVAGILGSDQAVATDDVAPLRRAATPNTTTAETTAEGLANTVSKTGSSAMVPRGLGIAEAELAAAEEKLAQATHDLADAERSEHQARVDEEAATDALEAARDAVERAEAAHSETVRQRREAAKALEAATRQRDRAQRGLDNATARVERLRSP